MKKRTPRLKLRKNKNGSGIPSLLGHTVDYEWDETDGFYIVQQATQFGIISPGNAVKAANDLEDGLIDMIDNKRKMGIL